MLGTLGVLGASHPRRRLAVAGAGALALGLTLVLVVGVMAWRAESTLEQRCQRHTTDSVARAGTVSGQGHQEHQGQPGHRVVVIGDSYSVGLGLRRLHDSWPSRLTGQVRVAGFSGSGFSQGASGCRRASFADRASAAVRRGADLVVVEGGLNDFDQSDQAIAAGFDRLMRALDGRRVVIVGPPPAPSRGAQVPRVDRTLAALAQRHGVPYVSARTWQLPYLPDRLHLTQEGHALFGDRVALALRSLAPSPSEIGSSA